MRFYAVKDGYLTNWGSTNSDVLPEIEGCQVFEGDPPPGLTTKPPPPPSYSELRFKEYPYVGEQLDMFWHAMDNGVIPKIEPFYSDIKAVKDKYPKP